MLANWEDLAFAHWLDEVEKLIGRKLDEALAGNLFACEMDPEEVARTIA